MFRHLIRAVQQSLEHSLRRIPSQCAVCRAWPVNGLVCEPCITLFAQPVPRCVSCALALKTNPSSNITRCGACLTQPPPVDQCLAAVSYNYPWNDCISSYKFHSKPAWAKTFSLLLQSTPWVEPALDAADLLLPVPLSTQRLRERGFNQALQLCKHLAPEKTDSHLLLRIKNTQTQSHLTRAERLKNVKSAFAVEPLRVQELAGKRVVLVDDVMTSGATLYAAARALRQAGAAHITAVVFARTETD